MSTVLVVDDSDVSRALLRRALEHAGLTTAEAARAHEGLRLLDEQPVDAMVIDIVMPGIDGIQLAQLVRARQDVDGMLPLVFYSAHIDKTNVRRRIAEVQPATVVAKDGNIQNLVSAVTSVISAHAAAKIAQPPAAVVAHLGDGLVAVSVQAPVGTAYELRRGTEVLLQAATLDELTRLARSAGLA